MRQMKDSGIEWIGEIPEGWAVVKLSSFYNFEKGKKAALYTKEYIAENIGEYPVFSGQTENDGIMGFVDSYDYDLEECLFTTTVGAKVMTPKVLHGKFCLSQNCLIMTVNNVCNNHFIFYFLNSLFDYEKSAIPSYMQPSLRITDLKKYIICLPILEVQQKIANFLNDKCKKIENLIAYEEATIEELKAYKQSVITEAVTKGLDKSVPMKDSGIAWVGDYPIHWTQRRGKFVMNLLSKPVRDDDGVITCFRDGEVTLRSNRRENGFTMADKEIGYQGIDIGDLVVHGMDGFAGAIGVSDSRGKGSPVLNVLDTKQDKRYIMYYLRSMAFNDVFTALSTGIRVRSCDLRWNKLAELLYPLPPIAEQHKIVQVIDQKCDDIDNLISIKQQKIEELKEYKKSLIYEYVTGKKEVS